jgi:hypothetical protein
VGGLLGALHGFQLIPDGIKGRVLLFDCMRQFNNNRRPEEYSVFRVWPYFLNMVPAHGPANTPIVPAKEVRVMKLGHDEDRTGVGVNVGASVSADQSNIQAVIRKFAERAHRTDMDSNVDVLDWIERTQQQHMDAILYLEKLKRVVSGGK